MTVKELKDILNTLDDNVKIYYRNIELDKSIVQENKLVFFSNGTIGNCKYCGGDVEYNPDYDSAHATEGNCLNCKKHLTNIEFLEYEEDIIFKYKEFLHQQEMEKEHYPKDYEYIPLKEYCNMEYNSEFTVNAYFVMDDNGFWSNNAKRTYDILTKQGFK